MTKSTSGCTTDLLILSSRGIDVSVHICDLPDSGLIARRIGTLHRMPVAHRDYLLSIPTGLHGPADPDDLSGHDCIVYTGLANSDLWTFTAEAGATEVIGTSKTVRIQGQIQTNSSEVIRMAVTNGMGIGYSPTWVFESVLASGKVEHLVPHWDSPKTPIHLVSPPERKHSTKVRDLMEHVDLAINTV